jgi:diguanylate cyclase (GGDEF)-like protein/PAS domain S-box-containing protein
VKTSFRRYLPLALSVGLVACMGLVGVRMGNQANDAAESVHRHDRRVLESSLAGLTKQYFQFAFKEAFDFASTRAWSLRPGDPGDQAALDAFAHRSAILNHGAALVGLDQRPLTSASAQPGLPPPTDAGYAPLVSALLGGKPGLSDVMTVGDAAVVAVGVPVVVDGAPKAVLLAYFNARTSPLQTYEIQLRQLGPGGNGFVLDGAGRVASAEDPRLIGTRPDLGPVTQHLAAGREGFIEVRQGDRPMTISYTPIGLAGWSIVRNQPTASFYGTIRTSHTSAERALLAILAIAAAALAIVTFRAEAVRRKGEARFRALVQHASDLITVVDAHGNVLFDSPGVERLLGYTPDQRVGTSGLGYLHPDDLEEVTELLGRVVALPLGESIRTELRVRHRNGDYLWFEAIGTNLLTEPSVRGLVVNMRDTSERRTFEQQLAHQAFHDPLTELPNRALFHDRLEVALSRRLQQTESVAVLFMDLDRFKVVNDSLGHDTGDEVLKAVAHRLRSCVRDGDTVARMSGDEFTILLSAVDGVEGAEMVAGRVIDQMREPFWVAGREVFVGVSVGIALADGEQTPDDLMRAADLAMYQAKERGRLRHEVYTAHLSSRASDRLELEADLRRALDEGELCVHYQPVVDVKSLATIGMEALVRWAHPRRGLLLPGHFIPLAEETGLVVPLGTFVLREALAQLMRWRDEGVVGPTCCVNVNVSGRQLELGPQFVETVRTVLDEVGADPSMLKLEITESVLMADADAATTTLRAIRALGVELAIDDFGAGYTSLNYLKHFPVSTLKLDRSFVHGLEHDAADAAIADAVVRLAHSLGVTVTAEGVELAAQYEVLRSFGCDKGQGYWFARPTPPEEMGALIRGMQPAVEVRGGRRSRTRTPST